jgi:hypothetical protein
MIRVLDPASSRTIAAIAISTHMTIISVLHLVPCSG